MNDKEREEIIADLHYIANYATALRNGVKNNIISPVFLSRMVELAEKVQRQLDPQYEEWVNEQARRGKSP